MPVSAVLPRGAFHIRGSLQYWLAAGLLPAQPGSRPGPHSAAPPVWYSEMINLVTPTARLRFPPVFSDPSRSIRIPKVFAGTFL